MTFPARLTNPKDQPHQVTPRRPAPPVWFTQNTSPPGRLTQKISFTTVKSFKRPALLGSTDPEDQHKMVAHPEDRPYQVAHREDQPHKGDPHRRPVHKGDSPRRPAPPGSHKADPPRRPALPGPGDSPRRPPPPRWLTQKTSPTRAGAARAVV
jgi:hypothetical protein